MEIRDVLWREPFATKIETKHHVTEDEVWDVFENSPFIEFKELGHIKGENLYAALGQTFSGRYLVVFFVHKKTGDALPISARDMNDTERRRYAKEKA